MCVQSDARKHISSAGGLIINISEKNSDILDVPVADSLASITIHASAYVWKPEAEGRFRLWDEIDLR